MRTALAFACLVALGCGGGSGTGSAGLLGAPASETWTHKELVEHLKGKGLEIEVVQSLISISGPMQIWSPKGGNKKITVDVVKCKTAEEARDSAGAAYRKDQPAFSWGRFKFSGDKELVEKIRPLLP